MAYTTVLANIMNIIYGNGLNCSSFRLVCLRRDWQSLVPFTVSRIGQDRKYTPCMTVNSVISLPKIPCIHCMYMSFWPSLTMRGSTKCVHTLSTRSCLPATTPAITSEWPAQKEQHTMCNSTELLTVWTLGFIYTSTLDVVHPQQWPQAGMHAAVVNLAKCCGVLPPLRPMCFLSCSIIRFQTAWKQEEKHSGQLGKLSNTHTRLLGSPFLLQTRPLFRLFLLLIIDASPFEVAGFFPSFRWDALWGIYSDVTLTLLGWYRNSSFHWTHRWGTLLPILWQGRILERAACDEERRQGFKWVSICRVLLI
jgi:hypothetical protein